MSNEQEFLRLFGEYAVEACQSTHLTRRRKALLTFRFRDGVFLGEPYLTFRPHGLIIWGAPERAAVEQCVISNHHQIVASSPPAPVEFFQMGKSYEQIIDMLAEGIQPPGWCTFDALMPGQWVNLRIRSYEGKLLGPDDGVRLCMWGVAVE